MGDELVASECRQYVQEEKYLSGYHEHYASKVQATYRMSTQRKLYTSKLFVRARAAQLIQSVQRGIVGRRRYAELRVERQPYMYFGFRSSLYLSSVSVENPRKTAMELAQNTERMRQKFLMQVLHGYVQKTSIASLFKLQRTSYETFQ